MSIQSITLRFRVYAIFLMFSGILAVSGCQTPPIPQAAQQQPALASPKSSLPAPLPQAQAIPPQFSEEVLKLQIFLDSKNFGPGLIDGRKGDFTNKVAQAYESLYGPIPAASLQSISPYTSYKIRAEDLARIGKMADSPQEIARQRSQPYTELIAFLAERYHTSRAFLRQINAGVNFAQLQAGDSVFVPNVRAPFEIENYAPAAKTLPDSMRKNRSVQIDTRIRLLKVLDSNKIIAVFPITPGSSERPAPLGSWVIQGIAAMPWYRYDKGVLSQGIRTSNFFMLPPGPRSPVGILWAGLNKPAIGIHGSRTPETIGRSASAGCIRLSNWDAARFRELVTVGNTVVIQ